MPKTTPGGKWWASTEPDEGGRFHIWPTQDGDEGHDLDSAYCDCGPRLIRTCSGCDGDGCGTCDAGWVDCGPFEAEAVVHQPLM